MRSRGMGYLYQPSGVTTEPASGKPPIHGGSRIDTRKRHRENAHSTKEADAARLLKLRLGQAALGMPGWLFRWNGRPSAKSLRWSK